LDLTIAATVPIAESLAEPQKIRGHRRPGFSFTPCHVAIARGEESTHQPSDAKILSDSPDCGALTDREPIEAHYPIARIVVSVPAVLGREAPASIPDPPGAFLSIQPLRRAFMLPRAPEWPGQIHKRPSHRPQQLFKLLRISRAILEQVIRNNGQSQLEDCLR
jgi:hypothetical protein